MKSKTIITIIRAIIICITLILYLFHRETFSPQVLVKLFNAHIILSLAIYFLLFTLRGFVLLPSTVLIAVGVLIFPPVYLYIVTLMGILSSSTIVYILSDYLGFDELFYKNYPKQLKKLQLALSKKELPIIIGWSFFPLAPTDMICFLISIIKRNYL